MKPPPSLDFMLRDSFPADVAARNLIMAAYAYYVLDSPIMDDALYDKLSQRVADKWPLLMEERKWALGNPEDTRASGSHFKFSTRAVMAVAHKFRELGRPEPPMPETWSFDENFGHYVTCVM